MGTSLGDAQTDDQSGHDMAMVVCSIKETKEDESAWFERCPRSILRCLVFRAKEEFGLEFKLGFEVEFNLLESKDATDSIQVGSVAYATSSVRSPELDVVFEIVDLLERGGVKVWKFHPEFSKGEYEIALSPNDPITAVDDLLYVHEVIKSVALKHGRLATMHPQPFVDGMNTIGQHTHISLNNADLSDQFLAGLLGHLRGITAILLGGYDSYGTRGIAYGTGDVAWSRAKNSPITQVSSNHYEIRVPDCLGKPYLRVASILGAGIDGVSKESKLTIKEYTGLSLEPMEEDMRKELGVTDRIPSSQDEAIKAMEGDEVVKEVLGEKCFGTYLKYRKAEVKHAVGMTRAARTKAIMENI